MGATEDDVGIGRVNGDAIELGDGQVRVQVDVGDVVIGLGGGIAIHEGESVDAAIAANHHLIRVGRVDGEAVLVHVDDGVVGVTGLPDAIDLSTADAAPACGAVNGLDDVNEADVDDIHGAVGGLAGAGVDVPVVPRLRPVVVVASVGEVVGGVRPAGSPLVDLYTRRSLPARM